MKVVDLYKNTWFLKPIVDFIQANKLLKICVFAFIVFWINAQIIWATTKWEDQVTYKWRYEEIQAKFEQIDEIDKKVALLESLSSKEFFEYFWIFFEKNLKTKASFTMDERIWMTSERAIYE